MDIKDAFREMMINYIIESCENIAGVLFINRIVEDSRRLEECGDGCCTSFEDFIEVHFNDANGDAHILEIPGTLADFLGVE